MSYIATFFPPFKNRKVFSLANRSRSHLVWIFYKVDSKCGSQIKACVLVLVSLPRTGNWFWLDKKDREERWGVKSLWWVYFWAKLLSWHHESWHTLKWVPFSITTTLPEVRLDHTYLAEALECTRRLVNRHKCVHKDDAASNAYEWKRNPRIRRRSSNKMRIMQN